MFIESTANVRAEQLLSFNRKTFYRSLYFQLYPRKWVHGVQLNQSLDVFLGIVDSLAYHRTAVAW